MASTSLSLKEYLKRYQSGADESSKVKKKKKKKEKPMPPSIGGGVLVVDEDPVWQKPFHIEDAEEEDNTAGDDMPQIEEDIEVKRMKRLEALRARKPYHGISEDGSGWIAIPSKSLVADGRDISPQLEEHEAENNDISLRQQKRRFDSESPREDDKPGNLLNADLSPPRQRRRRLDMPPSSEPQLKGSAGEAIDLSPPRSRRQGEEHSPPRPVDHEENRVDDGCDSPESDISPPRRHRKGRSSDFSPPKRTKRGELDDISPTGQARYSPSADLSPPRRTRNNPEPAELGSLAPDFSPPRRSLMRELSADISLYQRERHRPHENFRKETPFGNVPPPRVKDPSFTREGHDDPLPVKDMKEEIDRKNDKSSDRDPSLSGRVIVTSYRNKEAKRLSKEELLKSKEKKKEEKPLEWGKGLKQKREVEERAMELELEKERPFARSRDDPELDKLLKERMRWGDPMAHLVERKATEVILEDLGGDDKMKESGFIIPQAIPSHSWLKRGLDFALNRYGIRPGRHWDGVDRSNGYEKELFKRQNEKRATEAEAYLWSVSEM